MGLEVIAGVVAGASLGSGTGLGFLSGLGVIEGLSTYALIGGAVVGGSLVLQALQPKQHVDNQLTVKQASAPRTRAYGRCLLAGSYYFFLSTGGTLVSGFALCEGPIDGFDEHWLNGIILPQESDDNLNGRADLYPWYDNIIYSAQIGTEDQASNGGPGGVFPQYWTSDHRLRGIANTAVIAFIPNDPDKNFQKRFPSGMPSYLARIRGSRVYDPRDTGQSWTDASTWKWSANPALCILDYMTNARGMGLPTTRMDLASFAAMANLCDEPVGKADGSAETRYALWGSYTLDEEPKDVLARMLKTCDGELYPLANGTIGMRGGQWSEPTVTITPDMIISCQVTAGRDKLAKFNQLRIRYTEVEQQFQQIEGDPWDDVADQEASGEVLPEDFDIVMVPSYTQGQRLAKIFMAKSNPAWLLTITTNLAGLDALGERIVHVVLPDLSIDADFFVNGFDMMDDGATCQLTLGSLSAAAYEWSTAEEGNTAAPQVGGSTAPDVPPAPTGLTLSLVRTAVNGTTTVAQIEATVTTPVDQTLSLHGQYRASGETDWTDMSEPSQFVALSGVVADGVDYDVQVALETFGGTDGPFVSDTITIVADNVPPDQPTNFTATASGSGAVHLSWTGPGSANFTNIKVYRSTGTDFTVATAIATVNGTSNQAMSYDDSGLTAGTYNYWLTARNASSVASDPLGPISVTVA